MIVKDEEEWLAQCLESVQGAVDEIIVVDTGSSDRSNDIARQYGARIVPYVWCDDFAAARNAGLEQATGEWILFLDADGHWMQQRRSSFGAGRQPAHATDCF